MILTLELGGVTYFMDASTLLYAYDNGGHLESILNYQTVKYSPMANVVENNAILQPTIPVDYAAFVAATVGLQGSPFVRFSHATYGEVCLNTSRIRTLEVIDSSNTTIHFDTNQQVDVEASTADIITAIDELTAPQWEQFVCLASNVATSSTSFGDVTALQFPVVAGSTYAFTFFIVYDQTTTGRGSRWAVNGPTLNSLSHRTEWASAGTGGARVFRDSISAYDGTTANNGAVATTSNIAIIEGIIKCNDPGNVIARFATENVGNTVTAKAGSFVKFKKIS